MTSRWRRHLKNVSLFLWIMGGAACLQAGAEETGFSVAASPAPSLEFAAALDEILSTSTEPAPDNSWRRDFSSAAAYQRSVQPNRERLRQLLGAVDQRVVPTNVFRVGAGDKVAETEAYVISSVRWPVLDGVQGEGLWLHPKAPPLATVIAIPDASQTPEMIAGLAPGVKPELQFARRLAENGCEVLVPVLISSIPKAGLSPRLVYREWICRPAFAAGRPIVGLEVQRTLAAIDCLGVRAGVTNRPLGIVGWAEGGRIALYAAALDTRVKATLVCACFGWGRSQKNAPLYRRPFGLQPEFDDAALATLIAPRDLVVEFSAGPVFANTRKGRAVESSPDFDSVQNACTRAQALLKDGGERFDRVAFICGNEGMLTGPVGELALTKFLLALGLKTQDLMDPGPAPEDKRQDFDSDARQDGQFAELVAFTSRLSQPQKVDRFSPCLFFRSMRFGGPSF